MLRPQDWNFWRFFLTPHLVVWPKIAPKPHNDWSCCATQYDTANDISITLKQNTHLGDSSGLSHDLTPSLHIDFFGSKLCIIHARDQFSILSAELSDFLTSPQGSKALNNSVISSVRIHLQLHHFRSHYERSSRWCFLSCTHSYCPQSCSHAPSPPLAPVPLQDKEVTHCCWGTRDTWWHHRKAVCVWLMTERKNITPLRCF